MDKQKDLKNNNDWHAKSADEVIALLKSSGEGLSAEEIESRRKEHGRNELPAPEKKSELLRFLEQFNNVLIYVLIAAALFTAFLREWVDTIVIIAIVIINAIIGYIQEGKAEKAMESIMDMISPTATALREGEKKEIDAKELVPGDILFLKSGDKVPADVRILEAKQLHAEEAPLTGESEPVNKTATGVEKNSSLGDRRSMVYSGTMITAGNMKGIVVETGVRTEIGKIGAMVAGVEKMNTPLLQKIDDFGKKLSLAIIVVSVIIFLYAYYVRGFPVVDAFMAVVSLAVGAIPEGLPAIMTITLALGVQRMARQNAIIRKLPAVETLGSVTVICSDKTGTLDRKSVV